MPTSDIDNLSKLLGKLPGLGPRSARRAVLHMLKHREASMRPLIKALVAADENSRECEVCGNIDVISPCNICTDEKRNITQICVVEDVSDLWAIERSNTFKGRYHVLGGTLSAIDGRGPESLGIEKMIALVKKNGVQEVIMGTNATVEGQTTAHYVSERLREECGVKVSQLAHGIPLGGELDYMDDGTLGTALASRVKM